MVMRVDQGKGRRDRYVMLRCSTRGVSNCLTIRTFIAWQPEVGSLPMPLAGCRANEAKQRALGRNRDLYTQRLGALIEAKIEGHQIAAAPEEPDPEVINLIEAVAPWRRGNLKAIPARGRTTARLSAQTCPKKLR